MRKEILYAIIAGALFGLVIAFGIWKANKPLVSNSDTENQTEETKLEDNMEGGQNNSNGIEIAKPQNYQVIASTKTIVSGVTTPDSWVVVSGFEDTIQKSDDKGAFEIEFDLDAGYNELLVTSINNIGESAKAKLIVVSSTQFESEEKDENTASDSGDIKENVEQKLQDAKSIPLAFIGSVTDISSSTIEIKKFQDPLSPTSSEILQIATEAETTYSKDGDSPKIIKFEDLAIGDFIIAMGRKNGNGVLHSSRVVVSDTPTPLGLNIELTRFNSLSKNIVSLTKFSDNQKIDLSVDKNTNTYSNTGKLIGEDDLEESDLVISTYTEVDGKQTARSLFNVNPNDTPKPTSTPLPSPQTP